MADIQQELASLLGRTCAVSIRRTDETPPRLSVIDVAVLVTGKDARKTAQDIGYIKERFPEVAQNLGLYKFPGRRQRDTPVANIRGAIELCLLLPGRHAARIRRQAAGLLTRRKSPRHMPQVSGIIFIQEYQIRLAETVDQSTF